MRTIHATCVFAEFTVREDGSGLAIETPGAPSEGREQIEQALQGDYTGFYAEEVNDNGNIGLLDNEGPIPPGTWAHTMAAIDSLPGGRVLSIEGDDG